MTFIALSLHTSPSSPTRAIMSGPPSRIRSIVNHLIGSSSSQKQQTPPHIHHLSPTFFLERAAAIEPDADAVYHVTADGVPINRSYAALADRARGLAYFLRKKGYKRVGILAPNTPAFLEAIYGIVAAGGVIVPANYRLKEDDIAYIFGFAEVDCIIVDREFEDLLGHFRRERPGVPLLVDLDTHIKDGPGSGPYDQAVLEGLRYDEETGSKGWAGLDAQAGHEDDMLAIPFTSGTTSRPKGVVFNHRGAYLAALGNVIESNLSVGHCRYLWTLPMLVSLSLIS